VAVTIFGGLLSATLLDTLLTPVLFLRYGKRPLERLRHGADGRAETTPANSTADAF
jgi:HME family heavy-metal exporter